MNARLGLLLLIGLLSPLPALAKNAEDYFHAGSYKYVAGKRQDALLEVEEGLRKFPADPRLQGLAAQLRKLDDSQKNQSRDDKDKDKKDPDDKDSGKDKNKDKKDDGQKDKDKEDGKDKQDKQPPPRDDPKDDDKGGKNPPGSRPGEMSQEEAQRLLNSFAEDEKKEQRERQKLLRKRLETEQDW